MLPPRLLKHVNRVVIALLRTPAGRVVGRSLALLAYTDQNGARRELPVMVARDGDAYVALAGQPERKHWWRRLDGGGSVELLHRGRRRTGRGAVVDDEAERERALSVYLGRFPQARAAAEGAVVVRISLDG